VVSVTDPEGYSEEKVLSDIRLQVSTDSDEK
jgi:hypothetical protein